MRLFDIWLLEYAVYQFFKREYFVNYYYKSAENADAIKRAQVMFEIQQVEELYGKISPEGAKYPSYCLNVHTIKHLRKYFS